MKTKESVLLTYILQCLTDIQCSTTTTTLLQVLLMLFRIFSTLFDKFLVVFFVVVK